MYFFIFICTTKYKLSQIDKEAQEKNHKMTKKDKSNNQIYVRLDVDVLNYIENHVENQGVGGKGKAISFCLKQYMRQEETAEKSAQELARLSEEVKKMRELLTKMLERMLEKADFNFIDFFRN